MAHVTSDITATLAARVHVRSASSETLIAAAAHFTAVNSPGDIAAIFDRRLTWLPPIEALTAAATSAVTSSFTLDIGLSPDGRDSEGEAVIVSIDVDEPVPTIMLANFVHQALQPTRLRAALQEAPTG